jgi:hypothetical protein
LLGKSFKKCAIAHAKFYNYPRTKKGKTLHPPALSLQKLSLKQLLQKLNRFLLNLLPWQAKLG